MMRLRLRNSVPDSNLILEGVNMLLEGLPIYFDWKTLTTTTGAVDCGRLPEKGIKNEQTKNSNHVSNHRASDNGVQMRRLKTVR